MTALLILALSSLALVKFAVSQWRAIWISAASQPLSHDLHLATGIDDTTVRTQDFGTLIGLCNKLAPGLQKASPWLKEVSTYYRAVASVERLVKLSVPSLSNWAKSEMLICSRYVAVVLDQNLALQLDRQLVTRPQI